MNDIVWNFTFIFFIVSFLLASRASNVYKTIFFLLQREYEAAQKRTIAVWNSLFVTYVCRECRARFFIAESWAERRTGGRHYREKEETSLPWKLPCRVNEQPLFRHDCITRKKVEGCCVNTKKKIKIETSNGARVYWTLKTRKGRRDHHKS